MTFYTIMKSASLLWILFWGILLRLEKYVDSRLGSSTCQRATISAVQIPLAPRCRCSVSLCATCTAMSAGLGLASYGATATSLTGAALVLGASCLGGLRWSLSQRIMVRTT